MHSALPELIRDWQLIENGVSSTIMSRPSVRVEVMRVAQEMLSVFVDSDAREIGIVLAGLRITLTPMKQQV
jgi:hypothetical protein